MVLWILNAQMTEEEKTEVWFMHDSVCAVYWHGHRTYCSHRISHHPEADDWTEQWKIFKDHSSPPPPPNTRVLLYIPNWLPCDLASKRRDNKRMPLHSAAVALYRPAAAPVRYQWCRGLEQKMERWFSSWECCPCRGSSSASTSGGLQPHVTLAPANTLIPLVSVGICTHMLTCTHKHTHRHRVKNKS